MRARFLVDVLISVDLEGVAGIATRQQIHPAGRDYPIARALMTAEANAAVAGAFDGGATSVVVNDSHGPMDNLLGEQLDPRADYVVGDPKPLDMVQQVTSIAAGAARAVGSAAAGAIRPVAIPAELVIEAELRPNGAAELAVLIPGAELVGARTVRYQADSPRAALDVLIVWSALASYYLSR